MRIYYVTDLGAAETIWILTRQLANRGKVQIFTFKPPRSQFAIRLLRYVGVLSVVEMDKGTGDYVGDDGTNLYWHNDDLMTRITSSRFASVNALDFRFPLASLTSTRLRQIMNRGALADLYSLTLRLSTQRAFARERGDFDAVLLTPHTIFNDQLRDEFAGSRCTIVFCAARPPLLSACREILAAAKHFCQVFFSPSTAPDPDPSSKIAVQYAAGVNPDARNDLPWLHATGLSSERIIVYSEAPKSSKISKGMVDLMARRGLRYIDRDRWQPAASRLGLIRDMLASIAFCSRLIVSGLKADLSFHLWLVAILLPLARQIVWWKAFCLDHRIKLHLGVGDANLFSIAPTLGIEEAGGEDIAFQIGGSGMDVIFESRLLLQKYFFCWGSMHLNLLTQGWRKMQKGPRLVLTNGHYQGHLLRQTKDNPWVWELRQRGWPFVICVFDTDARKDFIATERAVARFWDAVLNLCAEHKEIAILVKTKTEAGQQRWECALERRPDIARDRLIVAPFSMSPFETVKDTNLALALYINSAGMEAALANVPHIYVDFTNWRRHPMMFENRLIARSEEKLRALVNEHRAGRGISPGDPDFAAYQKWLFTRPDDFGAERMGHCLRYILEQLDAGYTGEPLVERVAQKYGDEYGADLVHHLNLIR